MNRMRPEYRDPEDSRRWIFAGLLTREEPDDDEDEEDEDDDDDNDDNEKEEYEDDGYSE